MNSGKDNLESPSLHKIFEDGLDLYNNVDTTNEPLNTSNVQVRIEK